jgi:uncharacterized membrane protein YkoI
MMYRIGIIIVAAIAVVGFAPPMLAADQPSNADVQALAKNRVSLQDAVKAAEQKTGGKALDATFDANGPAPVYNVMIFQNGSIVGIAVDPMSGNTTMGSSGGAALDSAGQAQAASMQNANVSLGQATQRAEQQTNGKAIGAGVAQAGGATAYLIDVVANGAVKHVLVDPSTGAVHVVTP